MANLFRVGLTGGVGSGKSTVAKLLAEKGATIVDTDAIAHALTAPGGAAIPAIAARFGEGVLTREGALDRPAMRARVFSDPTARQDLEAILHPLIRSESQFQCDAAKGEYVVMVVPLLVENLPEYRPMLDRIAVVDCAPEQQIARTAARPGLDETQARAIMVAQASRSQRLELADDVIENQSDLAVLREKVEQLHGRYATLAAGKSTKKQNNSLR
jgi:dephospho-CoA kinase